MLTAQAQPTKNNSNNKKIDQANLDNILANYNNNGQTIYLANILTEQGFSTHISDVSIHMSKNNNFNFSGCDFNSVSFSGDFHDKAFENVKFHHSHFEKADFTHAFFNYSTFDHCDFKDTSFKGSTHVQAKIDKGSFWGSDFSQSFFYGSNIRDSLFTKSNFKHVTDYQDNKIAGMHIVFNHSDLSDYAFQKATYHEVKPSIAISLDDTWYSTPFQVIQEYNNTPVSISDYNPSIDDFLLANEVKSAINSISTEGLQGISIAQHVIHSDQPILKSIKDFAFSVMQECDALWIPGGPDVHPEFYGQQITQSYPPFSYYREILEFSLTDAAIALQKPIFGICHGSQLVNVFLGGTLHQHVDGNSGITPNLDILTYEGPLGSALDKNGTVLGPSYHHQAVDKVADSLEVVAKYKDVIKATQSNEGKPIMLCQFHPEHKADQNSRNILDRFIEFSTDSALKKTALKLADIIYLDNHFLDSANSTSSSASQDAVNHLSPMAPILPATLPEMIPTISEVVLA